MKAPALLLTHAAAAGLGWAFMATTFPGTSKEAARLPSKVDRSRELTSPARELLARIAADLPDSARPAIKDQKRAALQQAAEARLATLALPDDFPAAMEKAFEKEDFSDENVELAALFLAWGRRDFRSAMTWLREKGANDVPPFAAVEEMLGNEADPTTTLAQHDLSFGYTSSFAEGLVRKLFETRSLDEIKQLAKDANKTAVPELSYALAAQWPANQSMELVDLALSLKRPKWLDVHARSLGQNEGVLFLHSLLSLDLRPSFVRSILSGAVPTSFIAGAEGVAPDIRAEVLRQMGDVSPESADQEIESFQNDLTRRDVSAFLFPDGEPEPVQAFKTGDADALGLLREYQRRFPGYHKEPALRIELFKELAKIDPARAVVLLDFLDEAGRHAEVESLLEKTEKSHPDLTYQLLSLLPVPEDEDGLRLRLKHWQDSERLFRHRYQNDYQHWAEQLPTGADRDLALAALANAMEEKQLQEAARLRELIARPEIRALR